MKFNLSAEKVDNIKEYFIKMVKHELMFKEFFALKDITLKIHGGESWGIIGTNGSGKSTLLKLICGIIAPYKGSVKTLGQIAPMIELGAGFDGNLTARENIYLNGSILGRSRKSIQESFDKIVSFSEIGEFLDMPVKNFSSGMRARLGFSVATTVKPDVLVVDEVLAVGDIAFRKKCEKRMQVLLDKGTTLLYVSHSIESIREMCTHAAWLNKGEMIKQGKVDDVCNQYLEYLGVKKAESLVLKT